MSTTLLKFLIGYLLNPMTWLVIGLLFLWCRWHKISVINRRKALVTWSIFFVLFSTPLLPRSLYKYLEDQYPPLHISDLDTTFRYNIIVLGAGMGYDDRLPANSLLEPVMVTRLVEGIRIHQALPDSRLITSGHSSIGLKPQGEVAREAAVLIGVAEASVFAQGKPSNTEEEALEYVSEWGKDNPVIIATSAIHMPRAVFLFKKAGAKMVIAAPTHYKIKRETPFSILKFLNIDFALWKEIAACLHEIIGLRYAQMKN
jgi:uncharacterized SAM-binding protein YcdF (DUF218 family)